MMHSDSLFIDLGSWAPASYIDTVCGSSFRELRLALHPKESTILVSNGNKVVAIYDRTEIKWRVIDFLVHRVAFSFIGVKNYKIEAARGSL